MRHKKTTLVTVWQQDTGGVRDKRGNYPTTVFTTYVRWEKEASVYYGSDGREYRSENRLGVDVELAVGDYLARGDYSGSSSPVSQAIIIKDVKESPNWNGTKFDRWVLL